MAPEQSTILNVNERETARYYASMTLSRAGFRVLEAGSGADTLRIAQQLLPDLVVLDVHLPDLDGHAVCRMLKGDERTSSIAILQTSADYLGVSSKVLGLDSGADGYLAQPFEPGELVATVRALLRARAAERIAVEAQRKSEQALRQRDEFLGMASHELRSPASTIQLQIQTLLRRMKAEGSIPAEVLQRKLELLHGAAQSLTGLLNNLLDLTSLQDGRLLLHTEEIDLAVVAHQVAERYAEPAAKVGSEVRVHAPAPVAGRWDRTRMEQVVTNLLGNALKYASGAPVEISVLPWQRNSAQLVVRDYGPGIAPEHQARIFQRYERGADTRPAGLGLGLWIVQGILEAAGGSISVQSELLSGSSFTVLLPRQTP